MFSSITSNGCFTLVMVEQQGLVDMCSKLYCHFIIYVPQTGQRLCCCLQWKLNIDKAQAFTPDFIVLTNMFCSQNNLNLIIHQKWERLLSFSMSSIAGSRCQGSRPHADNTCKACVLFYTLFKANSARWISTREQGLKHNMKRWPEIVCQGNNIHKEIFCVIS